MRSFSPSPWFSSVVTELPAHCLIYFFWTEALITKSTYLVCVPNYWFSLLISNLESDWIVRTVSKIILLHRGVRRRPSPKLGVRNYIMVNGELGHKSNKVWGVIQFNTGIVSDTMRYLVLHLHPAQCPAAAPGRYRSSITLWLLSQPCVDILDTFQYLKWHESAIFKQTNPTLFVYVQMRLIAL